MSALTGLLGALGAFTLYYLGSWIIGVKKAKATPGATPEAVAGGIPNPAQLGIGFVTNFFDTLGIGSFAPTTAVYKFFSMVPDRLIPGTLNFGQHTSEPDSFAIMDRALDLAINFFDTANVYGG